MWPDLAAKRLFNCSENPSSVWIDIGPVEDRRVVGEHRRERVKGFLCRKRRIASHVNGCTQPVWVGLDDMPVEAGEIFYREQICGELAKPHILRFVRWDAPV